MPRYECANCGRTDFESFRELQDHDCEDWADDDPDGGATPPLVADGSGRRLYYAAGASMSAGRALHTDSDCRYLEDANTHSCPVNRTPRGTLCDNCEPDRSLEDLQASATTRAMADGGPEHE